MTEEWPKVRSRKVTKVSPWMEVIAREVEFTPGAPLVPTMRSDNPTI
jgi:hypothetical protein